MSRHVIWQVLNEKGVAIMKVCSLAISEPVSGQEIMSVTSWKLKNLMHITGCKIKGAL